MTKKPFDHYPRTALILLCLASAALIVVAFTDRGDMTSATLVLVGFASFFAGLFVISFHKTNPVSREIASLLPVHGSIAFARLCSDLGVQGNAYFIPTRSTVPEEIIQYNPVSAYQPVEIDSNYSFYLQGEQNGIVSRPAGYYLYNKLCQDDALRILQEEKAIFATIKEVAENVLSFADHAEARRAGDDIIVELRDYQLFSGCGMVREESPKCCTMAPCPSCSLIGCILSRGLNQTVEMKSITTDPATRGITLVLSPVA